MLLLSSGGAWGGEMRGSQGDIRGGLGKGGPKDRGGKDRLHRTSFREKADKKGLFYVERGKESPHGSRKGGGTASDRFISKNISLEKRADPSGT